LVYIKALNKLYGDVKGSDFNAAVSGAELPEAFRMIGDNARRIAKAYKAVKRGNFRQAYASLAMKARTPGKNAASHWLELQYGWLPLLKDVKDATQFIERRLLDPVLPRFKVRAQNDVLGKCIESYNEWATVANRQMCQLIYYPSAPLSLSESLGLTDPYSVLWEKLPYSFVIDWFLPVGPWISAMTAARTLKGTVIRTDTNISAASALLNSRYYRISGGENALQRTVTVNRTVGLPTPPSLPFFKPLEKALSVQHAMNGVALLANLKR